MRNPATEAKRRDGTTFTADLQRTRQRREEGRGTFDVRKGVPLDDGGIGGGASAMSRSFNATDRQQAKNSRL